MGLLLLVLQDDTIKFAIPDWAVHLIAIGLMTLVANYVRLLIKSVVDQIHPIKKDVSGLKKMSNWSSDSIITISSKTNIPIPNKPDID